MINVNPGLGNVFQQGVSGLQNSARSMNEAATDIVRSGTLERSPTGTTDIVEPLVRIRQEQQVFDASAQVVNVADEALGALIDIKA